MENQLFHSGDKFRRISNANFTTITKHNGGHYPPIFNEAKKGYEGTVAKVDEDAKNVIICTHGFFHLLDNVEKI